jgi:hypothetical protein
VAAVIFAHAGASCVWVYSTTLLQLYSDDRFRGRVFSADIGLLTLTISISSYVAGVAMDWGVAARTVAVFTGAVMLVPAVAWAAAMTRRPSTG